MTRATSVDKASSARSLRVVLPQRFDVGVDCIRRRLPNVDLVGDVSEGSPDMRAALRDADVVVSGVLSAEDLAHARRLRLVQVPGAGCDRVAASALPPGCLLCNSYGHERSIAEWVLMAMLALERRLLDRDAELREGRWSGRVDRRRDLRGRTVGIVGFGHIGRAVAQLARAIEMRTIAVTRSPDPARAQDVQSLVGLDGLDALLAESDFVVLALPDTPATQGLIGDGELRLIGPAGFLVNVGRASVVDEAALYTALTQGVIAGAALDVWYRKPGSHLDEAMPSAAPFWTLRNVVMSPHAAGATHDSVERRWSFVAEQLYRLAEGLELENVIARG